MVKPAKLHECPDWYHQYIKLVPEEDMILSMENQLNEMVLLLAQVDEEKAEYRYALNKWSIKELLGHLIDAERILTYRALTFARNDKTDLPQYDHENYMQQIDFTSIHFEDLKKEFRLLREANRLMFKNFDDSVWDHRGKANGKEFSTRAMLSIIIGHCYHHMNIIREKYL
ncbi:MAG: DinB family protein [Melioribacteraceae bacterium]|nr:DinB family protein [Melioribacteraceae bacterium]